MARFLKAVAKYGPPSFASGPSIEIKGHRFMDAACMHQMGVCRQSAAALGWRTHLNTVIRSLVRVLDFDGDVHAAAKDSDLYWCILAHSVQFTSLVHARREYEARVEFVNSF